MKIKIIIFLLISNLGSSQKISDGIFENVIKIEDRNITTNSVDYIFNII